MPKGYYQHLKIRQKQKTLWARRRSFQRQYPEGRPISLNELFSHSHSDRELQDMEKQRELIQKALKGNRHAVRELKRAPYSLLRWEHEGRKFI